VTAVAETVAHALDVNAHHIDGAGTFGQIETVTYLTYRYGLRSRHCKPATTE
jgi:hypothetical protein